MNRYEVVKIEMKFKDRINPMIIYQLRMGRKIVIKLLNIEKICKTGNTRSIAYESDFATKVIYIADLFIILDIINF